MWLQQCFTYFKSLIVINNCRPCVQKAYNCSIQEFWAIHLLMLRSVGTIPTHRGTWVNWLSDKARIWMTMEKTLKQIHTIITLAKLILLPTNCYTFRRNIFWFRRIIYFWLRIIYLMCAGVHSICSVLDCTYKTHNKCTLDYILLMYW